MINREKIFERFLKYVAFDTQSDSDSKTTPSTNKQLDLANYLVSELQDLGIEDAHVDDKGYVMATLPSNADKDVPTIGFISHMDTSPDMSGKDVKPKIIENYDGGDIVLNKEKNIILSTEIFPELKQYKGQTLITTDGTTLLGADDKAGIAEIITAIEYLVKNPELRHGTIKIGFTPDEEIGRGADHFDVKKFGASYGYTVDGGQIGEIQYETFNASMAKIDIQGQNVHPGYAKDKMINALRLATEFDNLIPANERPYNTEKYQGYFHLLEIQGIVEKASLEYIIRDHDRAKFDQRNTLMQNTVQKLNEKYGKDRIKMDLQHQYYNMKEKIEPVMFIVNIAKEAIKEAGITPIVKPVRGGTDGARLSYMGLPCPNLFAGGHNFHGKFEFIPLESMVKASEVIVFISERYAEGNLDKYKIS